MKEILIEHETWFRQQAKQILMGMDKGEYHLKNIFLITPPISEERISRIVTKKMVAQR